MPACLPLACVHYTHTRTGVTIRAFCDKSSRVPFFLQSFEGVVGFVSVVLCVSFLGPLLLLLACYLPASCRCPCWGLNFAPAAPPLSRPLHRLGVPASSLCPRPAVFAACRLPSLWSTIDCSWGFLALLVLLVQSPPSTVWAWVFTLLCPLALLQALLVFQAKERQPLRNRTHNIISHVVATTTICPGPGLDDTLARRRCLATNGRWRTTPDQCPYIHICS